MQLFLDNCFQDNRNNKHLLSTYYLLGTMLNALFSFTLTTALRTTYYISPELFKGRNGLKEIKEIQSL